jgi:short-subunit dehydrogenase
MVTRKRGRILNVASLAAFQPGPIMAVYYATKAYVLSFSEALSNELQGSGVTVTCLCPGPTRTGFMASANMGDPAVLAKSHMMMDAEEVAKRGVDGLFKGRRLVIPGENGRLSFIGKIDSLDLISAPCPKELTIDTTPRDFVERNGWLDLE